MRRTERLIYYIYWNELGTDAYLFGSTVEQNPHQPVRFSNRLMPPGSVIQQWDSIPYFGDYPAEPQLPLLEEGRRYRVRIFADCGEGVPALARIDFMNRMGESVGSSILKDRDNEFICPKNTYRYEIRLIQGGTNEVLFHHIELIPLEKAPDRDEMENSGTNGDGIGSGREANGWEGSPSDDIGEYLIREDRHNPNLCILLPDLSGHMFRIPEEENLSGLINVMTAPSEAVMEEPFRSDAWMKSSFMETILRQHPRRWLISFTAGTRKAAARLEKQGFGKAVRTDGVKGLSGLKIS